MFKGKKVLIGVTASIAAYKSAELVRLFKKAGAYVQVLQTKSSLQFIPTLTLSTLSKNPVLTDMVDPESGDWNNHVDLGLWADFMVIAPLTANTMSKMINGECDNLLLATYLSAKCPVYFAPAMDLDMYKHPTTIDNIKKLQSFGNTLIPSTFGELASGLIGEGRMAEPSEIIDHINSDLSKDLIFSNKKVLITGGPTYEAIDPVRFIGNHSTGKMAIALALECANNGAEVNLILGPSHIDINHSNVRVHKVNTADQMLTLVKEYFSQSDISIFAAAVSDYKPEIIESKKIKKSAENFNIKLVKNIDIAALMGLNKKANQFVVGFALETDNEIENAKAKLINKGFDMIVLNSLNDKDSGFGYNTNKITIIDSNFNVDNFMLKDKSEVAKDIIIKINELC